MKGKISKSASYLVRNPYTYCFRMNVPKDLQSLVGKKELRYSLKTGYLGVAKSKARLLAGLCQNLFYNLREVRTVMKLQRADIQRIVNGTIRAFLEYTEAHRVMGAKNLDFSSRSSALSDLSDKMGIGLPSTETKFSLSGLPVQAENLTQQSLIDADYTKYERTVATLIKLHNLDIVRDSIEYKQLSREFLIAYNKWSKVEGKRNKGDYSDNVESLFPLPSEPSQEESPSILLKDLIEEYKTKRIESKRWRPSTVRNHQPKINTMLQVLGNRPVSQITVEDIRRLAKLLELLPPSFANREEYEDISGLNPKDLKGKHDKTLDVSTRISYLNLIRSIFTYAEENEYIKKNPVISGVIPPKKKNTREQKLPFDDPEDLDKIFNPDVYLEACKDKPSRFWVPILALYTGCRREELCQLYTEDIQEIDGIWCLNIKGLTAAGDDDDQMLKTESAPRVIPLHPILVDELKFPLYVKQLNKKPNERIFTELKKYNHKYGHKLGDWFNRYIRTKKVGITNPKKSLHSFRHNVADHLYKELVPESLIEELEGRAGKTQTRTTYVMGHRVKSLYEECILKLNYKVDLSRLKNSKYVNND